VRGFKESVPQQIRDRILSANQRGVLERDIVFRVARLLGDKSIVDQLRHRRIKQHDYGKDKMAILHFRKSLRLAASVSQSVNFGAVWLMSQALANRMSIEDTALAANAARIIGKEMDRHIPLTVFNPMVEAAKGDPLLAGCLVEGLRQEVAAFPRNSPPNIDMMELTEECARLCGRRRS
jgi:hypothetical protein